MNRFVNTATEYSTQKLTENGALAYNTTNDKMLDMFATIGALRTRSTDEICDKFDEILNINPNLALKMLFYCGDIRKGLGERRTFCTLINYVAKRYPQYMENLFEYIPEYTRWDYVFALEGTVLESKMWDFVRHQLFRDLEGVNTNQEISLLAKWMPSINTSSYKTRALAKKAIVNLRVKDERAYRKMLSLLRGYLHVTEKLMSAREWDKIKYSTVSAYAMKNYAKAFFKHDSDRFKSYLDNVKKGGEKINSGMLYPYDLVRQVYERSGNADVIEEQWKALPNYIEEGKNILVMADVSGSMYGGPIYSSVGLAIYFAQHNTGEFKNLYMTFSERPTFVKLEPNAALATNVNKVFDYGVGYNTNLEAAFNKILTTAIDSHCSAEEMPKALVVISDMEIDNYMRFYGVVFVDEMEKRFNRAGYNMPKLILWNVESRHDTFLTKNKNVLQFSGNSSSTFKSVIENLSCTAYQAMINVLMDKRYEKIHI